MPARTDFYSISDTAEHIRRAQLWLRAISKANDRIPSVFIDGIYGNETRNAVSEFQKYYELPITGELDSATFDKIFSEYSTLLQNSIPLGFVPEFEYYEGKKMSPGDVFDDIYLLQLLLRKLSIKDDRFFTEMTGRFDPQTEKAVRLLQNISTLPETGAVDISLWNNLVRLSDNLDGYI